MYLKTCKNMKMRIFSISQFFIILESHKHTKTTTKKEEILHYVSCAVLNYKRVYGLRHCRLNDLFMKQEAGSILTNTQQHDSSAFGSPEFFIRMDEAE